MFLLSEIPAVINFVKFKNKLDFFKYRNYKINISSEENNWLKFEDPHVFVDFNCESHSSTTFINKLYMPT